MRDLGRPSWSRQVNSFFLAFAVSACAGPVVSSEDLSPAPGKRVEGKRGMVSASSPEAAAAGAAMLRQGGNAMDAAVATAFALSVTDISQTGLGGGGVLLWYNARTARAEHLLFYSRTGAGSRWGERDTTGAAEAPGRAAAIPGMVAGLLEAHRKFGRLPRAQVMAPAIQLAREGFTVTPLLARTIASARRRIEDDSAVAALLYPDGQPLLPGERLVQPLLAATLARIAAEGAPAFYSGPVAARLAAKVQAAGGLIHESDLVAFPVDSIVPLCATWRGLTVLSPPPPMGGAPLLAMMQMSEAAGVTNAGGFSAHPEAVVTLADVLRAAQADARWWRGDPRGMAVPARGFSSAAYARTQAAASVAPVRDTMPLGNPWPYEKEPSAAACAAYAYPAAERGDDPLPPPSEFSESLTSHLAVIDADGNAVSATTTVGVLFGSGVFTDGFFLNSSAGNMDDRTRGPNRVTNSTIAPTLVLDGRDVRLVIGAAGSQYIQTAVTQVALRILAFGEDPGRAIYAPRLQPNPLRRDVEVEPGFRPEVYAALVARGYRPISRVADIQFGGVHAIYVRPDGMRVGVADPRRDGVAVRQ